MPEKTTDSLESFTLEPMSAGDIIDRAVRLYKRNFLSLLKIVLAPSLIAYLGAILFSIGTHNFSLMRGDARVALTVGMIITGGLLWLLGNAAFYAIVGGASRSLIAHFFEGKPILVREVYRAVRQRFWALIGATLVILLMILAVSYVLILVFSFLFVIFGAIVGKMISKAPEWVFRIYSILSFLGIVGLLIFSFLLVYSRVVYVPQILMVEGKGVFAAISRSFLLARGEIIPIGAVILFWIYAAWSLWVLLAIPVGWYAYLDGVDITWFNPEAPLWYQIASQTLTKLSEILIWPIAMLCFTLLYINSRVRKEGYDIELLSNQVLAAPAMPAQAPTQILEPMPAFADVSAPPSILGLNDYRLPLSNAAPAQMPQLPQMAQTAQIEPASEMAPPMGPIVEPVEIEASPVSIDYAEVEPAVVEVRQKAVEASPPLAERKTCQWCGTGAGVQDRFCSVCGAVF